MGKSLSLPAAPSHTLFEMKITLLSALLLMLAGDYALADWRHEKEKPYRVDDRRDYQQRSVRTVQGEANSIVDEVKRFMAKMHITPARLALGLGLLGLFLTRNRNKRHVHWAVITGLCWLLIIFAAAAMFFDWPAFN